MLEKGRKEDKEKRNSTMFLRSASLSSTPFIHPAKIMVNKGITLHIFNIKKLISTQTGSVITLSHHLLTVKQVEDYSYSLVHEINITFKRGTMGKLL